MGVVRRLAGLVFGAAGLTGLLLCLAGLVGCWFGYREAVRYTDGVFGRAEGAVAEVQGNLRAAADRLRQAESELEEVRRREAGSAPDPPAQRAARRALSRKAVEAVGPGLGEARVLVARATEAGLVANGLLDALGELSVLDRVNVDTDGLKEASSRLSDLTDRSARLEELLARAAPPTDDEVARESSAAVDGLRRALALADAGSDRLANGRQRVADGHARVRQWINAAAVIVTVVLVWVGAGQLSLLVHARRLVRRRRPEVLGRSTGGLV
jgi:hypothetical protein